MQHNDETHQPYRLALTVGATVFGQDTTSTVEELIARADTAMYQARKDDHGQDPEGPVRILGWNRNI